MSEAHAAYSIGKHFYSCGIPVPEIFGFDHVSGLILCEDLGQELFHEYISSRSIDDPAVREFYKQAIAILVRIQLEGRKGFQTRWCWDTRKYDRQLMLDREAGYFYREFCNNFLGISADGQRIDQEFLRLADRAAQEPAEFLIHRDFQSRNLMVKQGMIRVIDFQGARLGPLAYDLASLVNDPYVSLSHVVQEELCLYYVNTIREHISLDKDTFLKGYYYIALLRNLQVLGAYSFLSQSKGKYFFMDYLKPALDSLTRHLMLPLGSEFPALADLAHGCAEKLAAVIAQKNH